MAAEEANASLEDVIEVDLRNPAVAGVLSWLWPGAGHIYQRCYAKGVLFMVCVLGIYFFGLAIADGRAVYASFTQADRRWQYICQVGVGGPSLLALVQRQRVIIRGDAPLLDGLMAPPPQPVMPEAPDALADWHRELHMYLDLGTLFTMVAGLLNVLVIYDACAGPMAPPADESQRGPPGTKRGAGARKESEEKGE